MEVGEGVSVEDIRAATGAMQLPGQHSHVKISITRLILE